MNDENDKTGEGSHSAIEESGQLGPTAPNRRRQASHIISAFRFQLLETAIAWLQLGDTDTLLIEIFEDFDVQTDDGDMQLTQIKHSAINRQFSLQSKDARQALDNYWTTSQAGSASGVSLVVHTNYGHRL